MKTKIKKGYPIPVAEKGKDMELLAANCDAILLKDSQGIVYSVEKDLKGRAMLHELKA